MNPVEYVVAEDVVLGTCIHEERPLFIGTRRGIKMFKVCDESVISPANMIASFDLVADILLESFSGSSTDEKLSKLSHFRMFSNLAPPSASLFYSVLIPEFRDRFSFNFVSYLFRLVTANAVPFKQDYYSSCSGDDSNSLGLFYFSAACPHSCSPNALVHVEGSTSKIFILNRLVRKGDTIRLNFLPNPSVTYMSTFYRRQYLYQCLSIQACDCDRCTRYPEISRSLVCPNCDGFRYCPSTPVISMLVPVDMEFVCLDCSHRGSVSEPGNERLSFKNYEVFKLLIPETISMLISQDDIEQRVLSYVSCLMEISENFPEIFSCYFFLGDIFGTSEMNEKASKYYKLSLDGFAISKGKNSLSYLAALRRWKETGSFRSPQHDEWKCFIIDFCKQFCQSEKFDQFLETID